MTRTEAAHSVRNRWERLGIGTPEEFPHVFSSDVDNLLEELSSTGNILDVAPQQEHPTKAVNHADGTGVVANRKPSINTNSDTHLIRKNSHSEGGEATAIASPLYLLASEIVDVVEFAAQYRAEEEATAEECALIEASGYLDPVYEVPR